MRFMHFFNLLALKAISVEHNALTIFILLKMATCGVEDIGHFILAKYLRKSVRQEQTRNKCSCNSEVHNTDQGKQMDKKNLSANFQHLRKDYRIFDVVIKILGGLHFPFVLEIVLYCP
jgi:hypothetical protein